MYFLLSFDKEFCPYESTLCPNPVTKISQCWHRPTLCNETSFVTTPEQYFHLPYVAALKNGGQKYEYKKICEAV